MSFTWIDLLSPSSREVSMVRLLRCRCRSLFYRSFLDARLPLKTEMERGKAYDAWWPSEVSHSQRQAPATGPRQRHEGEQACH